MEFKLEINTKTKQLLNLNSDKFKVKEIQKNRLNEDTVENKITLIFNDLESYKEYGEPIISTNIESIKLTAETDLVIFERDEITQENISLFSNISEKEINLDIIVFDKITAQ